MSLNNMLQRRDNAEKRIAKALSHLERGQAIHVVCSFLPVKRLEEIATFQERRSYETG